MTQKNLHKRIKMGNLPGDIPIQSKVTMLEKPKKSFVSFGSFGYSLAAAAKGFKKMIRMKEKAVLKERTRDEIKREMSDE
jgi:hypothetical protein